MKSREPRHESMLSSFVVGILGFIMAAPAFAVFVPVVAVTWILARLGVLPRRLHSRGESVKLVGGPRRGDESFAEVSMVVGGHDSDAAARLLRALVEHVNVAAGGLRIDIHVDADWLHDPAGTATRCLGAGVGPVEACSRVMPALLRDVRGAHVVPVQLFWASDSAARDGAAAVRPATEGEVARWSEAWASLVRAHDLHQAVLSMEVHASGRTRDAFVACLLGRRDAVASAVESLATWLREERGIEAWTGGSLRRAS